MSFGSVPIDISRIDVRAILAYAFQDVASGNFGRVKELTEMEKLNRQLDDVRNSFSFKRASFLDGLKGQIDAFVATRPKKESSLLSIAKSNASLNPVFTKPHYVSRVLSAGKKGTLMDNCDMAMIEEDLYRLMNPRSDDSESEFSSGGEEDASEITSIIRRHKESTECLLMQSHVFPFGSFKKRDWSHYSEDAPISLPPPVNADEDKEAEKVQDIEDTGKAVEDHSIPARGHVGNRTIRFNKEKVKERAKSALQRILDEASKVFNPLTRSE